MPTKTEMDKILSRGLAQIMGGKSPDWDGLISELVTKSGTSDARGAEEVLERLRADVRELVRALGETKSAYDAAKVGAKLNDHVYLLKGLETALNQRLTTVHE